MVGGKIQNVLLLQNSSDASSDAIGNEIIAGPIEATPRATQEPWLMIPAARIVTRSWHTSLRHLLRH